MHSVKERPLSLAALDFEGFLPKRHKIARIGANNSSEINNL
jgi:hypothetical protein